MVRGVTGVDDEGEEDETSTLMGCSFDDEVIDIGRPLLPVEEFFPAKSMLDRDPPPPPPRPLSLKLPKPSLANVESRSMLARGELVEGKISLALGTILEAAFLAVAPRLVRDLRKFHSPSKVTSPNSSDMDS